MKEYKRLTNKDWKENYDIFEDVCCDTCTEDCGECERNFNALVRLAELEDKIENSELISPYDIGDNEIAFFVKHNAEVRASLAKEFSEKVRERALSHCKTINCYELTFIEETIDELLKEYEK